MIDGARYLVRFDDICPGMNWQVWREIEKICGDSDVRLTAHDADWLYDLIEDREWFWICGPDQAPVPEGFGGTVVPHLTLGGIKFRYEPVRAPVSHEIAGRMHPVAQISEYGHVMRGRCFVSNGMRLILPSMGARSLPSLPAAAAAGGA